MQAVHAVAVVVDDADPGLHAEQPMFADITHALEMYVPGEQVVEHGKQVVRPYAAAYMPAVHELHVVAPVMDIVVPGLHARHAAFAIAFEYVPGAHWAHAIPETYVPGPHGVAPYLFMSRPLTFDVVSDIVYTVEVDRSFMFSRLNPLYSAMRTSWPEA
jgi:hypothetical protein